MEFSVRIGRFQSRKFGLREHDVLIVSGEHQTLAFDLDAGDIGFGGGYLELGGIEQVLRWAGELAVLIFPGIAEYTNHFF